MSAQQMAPQQDAEYYRKYEQNMNHIKNVSNYGQQKQPQQIGGYEPS